METWQLRAEFARRLSHLYGTEVPAYSSLVEISHAVNAEVLKREGVSAERFGSIGRVSAERHGAIRVGTPVELAEVARIFGALGMYPAGFYDLRDAAPSAIPVISSAFRPIDLTELARNPFRVFVSMLVPEDRRFFDPDLAARLRNFLSRRTLFPEALLTLADRARAEGSLMPDDAERFLRMATASFALSSEPVDQDWYAELERVSSVAADIGGVTTTHLNHLTPRVLDIDDLYRRMQAHGVVMIDEIQGPPRWHGPDVLLRQTSFRALAEPRTFRLADGTLRAGELRVRFGEVEARGVALTPKGRDLYDAMVVEVDRAHAANHEVPRRQIAERVWRTRLPSSEYELAAQDLAFFTFGVDRAVDATPAGGGLPPSDDLVSLLDGGRLVAHPIVYEDFLPRSAAGIFSSNLTGAGSVDAGERTDTNDGTGSVDADDGGAPRDVGWLADAIGQEIHDPMRLYAGQRAESLRLAAGILRLDHINLPT